MKNTRQIIGGIVASIMVLGAVFLAYNKVDDWQGLLLLGFLVILITNA